MTGGHDNPGGTGNVWGELDGIRYVSGFNNTSENTTVIDGVTHVVLGDCSALASAITFCWRWTDGLRERNRYQLGRVVELNSERLHQQWLDAQRQCVA